MLTRKRSVVVIALALAGVVLSSYSAAASAASRDRWVFRPVRFSYSVAGNQTHAWTLREHDDEGLCREGFGDESWQFTTRPKTLTIRFGFLRGRLLSVDLPQRVRNPSAPSPGTNTIVRNATITEYPRGDTAGRTCDGRSLSFERRPFDCGTRTSTQAPRISMEVKDFSPEAVVSLDPPLTGTDAFDNCWEGVRSIGVGVYPEPLGRVANGEDGRVEGELPNARMLNRAIKTIRVRVSRGVVDGGTDRGDSASVSSRTTWTLTLKRRNAG